MIIVRLIVLIIALNIVSPVINDYNANTVEKELVSTPLPENTILVNSYSEAGKLVGNGNGMQFYGEITVQSELTLEELDRFYSQFRENEWSYIVEEKVVESSDEIQSDAAAISEDYRYYKIYSWGSGDGFFEYFDLRGH